jgi:FAD/FMN-containing dehydrogenase
MSTVVGASVSIDIVSSNALDQLRSRISGEVITPQSEEYDDARRLRAITVDRRPLVIVRAKKAEDVSEAVQFARSTGLPLSVRGGGHSLAQFSVIDGAVVVDLSKMRDVDVDPVTRIARAQGGATSNDLAVKANAHGLALTTGDTYSVGLGGLTTGGGIGFMVREYGLAIDSLIAAQVVLADGRIVMTSADEHPDLFWAIRGGGGNFGVVTEFMFKMAPVATILGGDLILPATREVIRGYLQHSLDAPKELTTIANLLHAGPAPYVPEEHVGGVVLQILVAWTGDPEEGERALAPLRGLATPIADTVSVIPYPEIYKYTAHYGEPHGSSIRMMFADALSDESIDASLDAMHNSTSPFSLIQFRGLGGALAQIPDDATAFAHRKRNYFYAIIGVWLDPSEEEAAHQAWTSALWQRVRPEGRGVYVNFLESEGEARIREAYPDSTYKRLAVVKQQHDPENLFRFNQNVKPEAGSSRGV